MPREILDIPLQPAPAGTRRSLRVVRFGAADARPKAYVQAGLHADETPGLLAVQHLIRMLDRAERTDGIPGQVVVVPYANPIGLAQFIHGEQSGRFDLATGSNFNRGWPDLAQAATERITGRLGGDGNDNVELIRRAMREALDAQTPVRELDALHVALAREACDADLVLDLHCDDESLMHLFVMKSQWPLCRDLAGDLGCRAVLFADNAGRGTFMESLAAPWRRLAAQHPGRPIPQSCLSLTVELRGYADVSEELAAADAAALFRALQRRGMVAGNPGRAPDCSCEPAGLDACDIIRAPCAGIVNYRAGLGQRVSRGDCIAEVIDPSGAMPGDRGLEVQSGTDGVVLTRRLRRLVAAGEVIAKVAGGEPLPHRRGWLLED